MYIIQHLFAVINKNKYLLDPDYHLFKEYIIQKNAKGDVISIMNVHDKQNIKDTDANFLLSQINKIIVETIHKINCYNLDDELLCENYVFD